MSEYTGRAAGVRLGWTSRACIRLHGLSRRFQSSGMGGLARIVQLVNRVLTGADIDPGAQVSPQALIPHTIGIVIGQTSIVEAEAILMPHVVLGARDSSVAGRRHPLIARGACVGAGAVVLGPVCVGEGATVGANAVVLNDVPAGKTVVGAPAKPIS